MLLKPESWILLVFAAARCPLLVLNEAAFPLGSESVVAGRKASKRARLAATENADAMGSGQCATPAQSEPRIQNVCTQRQARERTTHPGKSWYHPLCSVITLTDCQQSDRGLAEPSCGIGKQAIWRPKSSLRPYRPTWSTCSVPGSRTCRVVRAGPGRFHSGFFIRERISKPSVLQRPL